MNSGYDFDKINRNLTSIFPQVFLPTKRTIEIQITQQCWSRRFVPTDIEEKLGKHRKLCYTDTTEICICTNTNQLRLI